MKVPYIEIKTDDLELTGSVLSFSYEDTVNQDNMITIILHREKLIDEMDEGNFESGVVLFFSFGYLGKQISKTHTAVITDYEIRYSDSSITIHAFDAGTVLKKGEDIKVWGNITSSQIAEEIAKKYNMKSVVDNTDFEWEEDSLPQFGRSDFEFLTYLTEIEKDGNYIFYSRNDTLYFVRRALNKKSSITYEYANDDSIISFIPSYRDSTQDKEANSIELKSFDSNINKAFDNSIEKSKEDVVLGNFENEYQSGKIKNILKKLIPIPNYPEIDVSNNIGNSARKKASLKILVAQLIVEGNPLMLPDTLVTVNGKLIKKHIGNWYIEKVTHKINTSGYITILGLVKNGSEQNKSKTNDIQGKNVSISKTSSPVNSTKGKVKIDNTIVINVYDENAELIGGKTKTGKYIPIND